MSVASGLNIPEYNEKDCVTAGFYWHGDNVCRSIKAETSIEGWDKLKCNNDGFYYSPSGICDSYRNTDGSFKVKSTDYFQPEPNTEKENNELIVLIFLIFIGGFVTLLIINKSLKKTKEVYKSSTIPLKNKVKRKELETRLNELDEVKPAEHTYKKTAYVDDTEEINEVKKLERQIKIKKLQKELKDLEEE